MRTFYIVSILALSIVTACSRGFTKHPVTNERPSHPNPPRAKQIPTVIKVHEHELIDNYQWLKDRTRTNDAVLDYIATENHYTDRVLASTKDLQEQLFKEMVARIQESDLSVPVKVDDYYYYSREEKGQQYSIYCRKFKDLDAAEEVILDVNILAKGLEFCSLLDYDTSPDHRYLAYAVDTTGGERPDLYIKDLSSGIMLSEVITEIGEFEWANDNRTIFYTKINDADRTDKLYRHVLGDAVERDELLFQELDDAFYVWLSKTRSRRFLLLGTGSKTTSEMWYLDADDPTGTFTLVQPREPNVEYYLVHHGDHFFIHTNLQGAKNFKIMVAPLESPSRSNWRDYRPYDETKLIYDFSLFRNYMVIQEFQQGVKQLRIIDLTSDREHYVEFPEPTYIYYLSQNPMFETELLRFSYESLVTPYVVYDYHMATQARELKKQQIVNGYDHPEQYRSERIYAPASDGTQIPISLVYNANLFTKDGSNPLHLYGYGAYGETEDPYFSSVRLSLLDRGFVYAIAHIRGGRELGEEWYQQGKMLNKKNTFTDFIACAEFLIQTGYGAKDKLVIEGGSAGGLLIGAVINSRPDLARVAIADVPFVDVINTMLDASQGPTVSEYEEWGNPAHQAEFEYMLSYCPYQNVKAQAYPNLYISAGFHDPRVNYWEPLKWTAKLRALKTDNNLLVLRVNMSGHGGASGRYDIYKSWAEMYAFVFDILELGPTALLPAK